MNVVNVAVPVIITAVAGLFAGIGPDEIRKSRMRNIQTAVNDGDDYFRLFSGGGFYPLPHRPLSNGLRKASPKTTKNQGEFPCANSVVAENRHAAEVENKILEFIVANIVKIWNYKQYCMILLIPDSAFNIYSQLFKSIQMGIV